MTETLIIKVRRLTSLMNKLINNIMEEIKYNSWICIFLLFGVRKNTFFYTLTFIFLWDDVFYIENIYMRETILNILKFQIVNNIFTAIELYYTVNNIISKLIIMQYEY